MGKKLKINTGEKYGRWSVIKETERVRYNESYYRAFMCKCDCGNEGVVVLKNLTRGDSKSCGCISREMRANYKKHGNSYKRLYPVWRAMIGRCYNKEDAAYKYYGERGILVCKEWVDDYLAFEKWAFENGYKEGLTVEREDNNKGYSPQNCILADWKAQANNKRNNRLISFNGETKTISQWADFLNAPYYTIKNRVQNGWPDSKIISTPIRKKKSNKARPINHKKAHQKEA